MTPLEKLLRVEGRRTGVGVEVVLKDYAIGHILGAISAQGELADLLMLGRQPTILEAVHTYIVDYQEQPLDDPAMLARPHHHRRHPVREPV